jgi:hypothetical protein
MEFQVQFLLSFPTSWTQNLYETLKMIELRGTLRHFNKKKYFKITRGSLVLFTQKRSILRSPSLHPRVIKIASNYKLLEIPITIKYFLSKMTTILCLISV